ncbi:hypothetical protein D5S17_29065 [Pseudonocardiaceae bacterium YIM PH 21723]|nr:hypothetical protein D5S17_29065 [Pseudonocardiaceae bacterium YIM PH 21723]
MSTFEPRPGDNLTDDDLTWAVLQFAIQQLGGSVVVPLDELPNMIGREDGSHLAILLEPAEVDGRPAARFTVERRHTPKNGVEQG